MTQRSESGATSGRGTEWARLRLPLFGFLCALTGAGLLQLARREPQGPVLPAQIAQPGPAPPAAETVAAAPPPPASVSKLQLPLEQPEAMAIEYPPPPVRGEVVPQVPSADSVWVAGHFAWDGDWTWNPGAWTVPPRPGLAFNPPYYEMRDDVLVYVPAYWRRPGASFVPPAPTLVAAVPLRRGERVAANGAGLLQERTTQESMQPAPAAPAAAIVPRAPEPPSPTAAPALPSPEYATPEQPERDVEAEEEHAQQRAEAQRQKEAELQQAEAQRQQNALVQTYLQFEILRLQGELSRRRAQPVVPPPPPGVHGQRRVPPPPERPRPRSPSPPPAPAR